MEIYLLRHGRSRANMENLVTGSKADVLCPEGRQQAAAASGLLRRCGLDDVGAASCFVSDWERAQETAALAIPDLSFTVDPRLGETDAGEAAQMKQDTFKRAYPDFWSLFLPERPYPGGESHADLFTRVLDWLHHVENTLPSETRVLAVTHAGPICCLLHTVCKVDMSYFPMFLATNASLTKLERLDNGPWRLAFFSLSPEIAA